MRCPAALPTASGASCADVCANTLDGPAPFKVACRSVAPSCVAADACEDAATVSSETTLVLVGKTPEAGPAASARQAAASPSCATWCAHAKALGCPASLPTLKGASCVEVCSNVQKGPVPWDLRCRAEAKTCATADACEKR